MVPADLTGSCSGDIIRAHTVPKSASLKRIAREGHVYAFVPSVQAIARGEGTLAPELVGVNRASTFTGFCGHHDKEIFAPVVGGYESMTDGQTSVTISHGVGDGGYILFPTFEWLTTGQETTHSGAHPILEFSVPAPLGAKLRWVVFS